MYGGYTGESSRKVAIVTPRVSPGIPLFSGEQQYQTNVLGAIQQLGETVVALAILVCVLCYQRDTKLMNETLFCAYRLFPSIPSLQYG